jgi:DMSO/TMAO reductase YedYZ molybdopterin-dependent catalytic subunit
MLPRRPLIRTPRRLDRRRFLALGTAGIGASLLGGCSVVPSASDLRRVFSGAQWLTLKAQRLVLTDGALAREFSEADISPAFRANGTTFPDDEDYESLVLTDFARWRLEVGGLVDQPASLSLAELRQMPARTQITRHDCVEGWSCIGKWKGPMLSTILDRVGLKPEARYIVFHCADKLNAGFVASPYYESIDLIDAFHPQTILAYEMNDRSLPVEHGAPLRLRVERQLGYKMAKYIMRIEAVASYTDIGDGKGGFWEDQGYEWYAGI